MQPRKIAVLTGAFPLFPAYVFSEEISRDGAMALMDSCRAEREVLIAPESEAEIKGCIERRRKSPDYCKRFYRDYGERRTLANGNTAPGKYWDIPTCEKAYAAEQYFRRNPRMQVFSYP